MKLFISIIDIYISILYIIFSTSWKYFMEGRMMKSVVRKFRIFIRRHSHNKEDRKLANAFIAHLKRQPAQDEISHRLLEKKYTPRTLAEAIKRRRHPIYEHVLQLIRRRAKLHRRDPFEMVGSPRFRLL